jgi:hypothetical protein
MIPVLLKMPAFIGMAREFKQSQNSSNQPRMEAFFIPATSIQFDWGNAIQNLTRVGAISCGYYRSATNGRRKPALWD